MSVVTINENILTSIANAIRNKLGVETTYKPNQMANAIGSIETPKLEQKTITANGEYLPSYGKNGFSKAIVAVPNSYSASDEGKVVSEGALVAQTSKNINANGTHDTTTNDEVVVNVANSYSASDEGKVVDQGALVVQTSKNIDTNGTHSTTTNDEVVVAVPNSYSASDEGKVVSSGELVSQTSQSITENGTYDTTLKNEVVVNVSGGGGGSELPSTFQQVEYISTTGTQYCVINFQLQANDIIETSAALAVGSGTGEKAFAGNDTQYLEFYFDSNDIKIYGDTGATVTRIQRKQGWSEGQRAYLLGKLDTYNTSRTGADKFKVGLYKVTQYQFSGNVYLFRVYRFVNDVFTCVCNLVPCYRKADNVIGLYDVVNNVFYTNAGSGNFGKGSDV